MKTLQFALMGMLLLVPATWLLFLAIMSLARARDAGTLSRPVELLATGILAIGYLSDFLLNLTLGTILFMELPREYLLSPRVARLQREGAGYRQAVATWICHNLLDPFDPSGCHCRD
jgi:hypothetical protein